MSTIITDSTVEIPGGGVSSASDYIVDTGGEMHILNGGSLSDSVAANGGTIRLDAGGSVRNISATMNGESWIGGPAENLTADKGGHVYVSSGGSVSSATVGNGGLFDVFAGGKAKGVEVNLGGCMLVSSGGRTDGAEVNYNGSMLVDFQGTADNIMLNSGGHLEVRGIANSTTVNSKGNLEIESGGTATAIIWTPCEGHIHIADGGHATFFLPYSGVYYGSADLLISKAAAMDGKTIGSGGELYAMSGGTANGIQVNAGGSMWVWADGSASGTAVNSGGCFDVSSGATANDATVNSGGSMLIRSGATVNGTTVNSGGSMLIRSGATVNGTTVNSKGLIDVSSGVTAKDTTVSSGGSMLVRSGAVASNVTVNANGRLEIESGGQLTGQMHFAEESVVTAGEGTVLDFSISYLEPFETALVNDLSVITGNPAYVLTVGDYQTAGMYCLAGNAAGFDGTISVTNYYGDDLGVLTVDGTADILGVEYKLNLNGDNLIVTVGDPPPENGPAEPDNNTLYISKKKVNEKVTESYGTHLSAPGDEIRLDKIGSVSWEFEGVVYHNYLGTDDMADYAKIVLAHGAELSFHVVATAMATFTVYSLTEKDGKYSKKTLQTLKLKYNEQIGLFTADSSKLLKLQTSGAYYVSMQLASKDISDAIYNVSLNGEGSKTPSVFYPLGDNSDDWGDRKTSGYDGTVGNLGVVNASSLELNDHVIRDEWIGFGDKVDYKKFTLNSAAELSLTVTAADGPLKLTVCRLKETVKKSGTTYSQVTIRTVTLKASKGAASLNLLRLAAGDYYFKVESTNVKKSTAYDVQVTHSDFYVDGDKGWNNVLLNGKKLNEDETFFYDNILSVAGSISLDRAGNYKKSAPAAEFTYQGKQYGGFVGYGDTIDYGKLTLAQSSDVLFTINATDNVTLEVIKVTLKNGRYTKKSLSSLKYKASSGETAGMILHLDVKENVTYYVSVKATNVRKTNANPKAYYNVSYIVGSTEAAPLAMPEDSGSGPDTQDGLGFGQYASADTLADASAFTGSTEGDLLRQDAAGLLA